MATKFSDFSTTVPSFISSTQHLVGYNAGGSNIRFTMLDVANNLPYTAGTGLSLSSFSYSLDVAGSGALGGIAIGYVQNAQNYPVELDGSNQAFVAVPWTDTDTTYALDNSSTDTITLTATPGGASGTVQLTGSSGITITPSAGVIDISTSITQGFTTINVNTPLLTTSTTPPTTTISMTKSGVASDGWLSSVDWNTFNNKGSGTVTSVDINSPGSTITASGGPITGTGTLSVDLPTVIAGGTTATPSSVTVDDQGRVTSIVDGSTSRDTGWSPFEIYGGEQVLASDFGTMVQAVASSTFVCNRAKVFVSSAATPSGGPVIRIDIYRGNLKTPAAGSLIGGGTSGTLVTGINEITITPGENPGPVEINAGTDYVILIRCSGSNLSFLGKQVPVVDGLLSLAQPVPISVSPPLTQNLEDIIISESYGTEEAESTYRICCHLYEI